MIEIRFHGRGGQGAVTAAELTAQAAISEGKFAQAFPNFGPERRGAPVTAFLRISGGPILLRERIDEPNVVVVLDPTLIDLQDVCEGMENGGTLIINDSGINRMNEGYLSRYSIAFVDASTIAQEVLGVPITNTAIIGALIKATDIVKLDSLDVPFRGRFGKLADKNIDAMRRAYKETVVQGGEKPLHPAQEPDAKYGNFASTNQKVEALLPWDELEIGGDIIQPGSSTSFFTGNWRSGGHPVVKRDKCVRCGICWSLCPDIAYRPTIDGYYDCDQRYCKGCGICAEECPRGAIEMGD